MNSSISLVIPAFNEVDRLPKTLESIRDFFTKEHHGFSLHEVIIVDDGSSDGTSGIASEWKDRIPVHTVRLLRNRGKGAALRRGVRGVSGDAVLLYDADAATPIEELYKLFTVMQEQNADIVIGSRVLGDPKIVTMSRFRRITGRLYHWLCSLLIPGIHDAACGCKLFRASVAKHLFALQKVNRFAYDIEILSHAQHFGYHIAEVPVTWTAVPESKVRIVRDGCEMFIAVLRLYGKRFFGFYPKR